LNLSEKDMAHPMFKDILPEVPERNFSGCIFNFDAFRFSQGTVSEAFHGQAPRALHCKPSDKLYQNGEDSALVIVRGW
jgi:hypothetical protein